MQSRWYWIHKWQFTAILNNSLWYWYDIVLSASKWVQGHQAMSLVCKNLIFWLLGVITWKGTSHIVYGILQLIKIFSYFILWLFFFSNEDSDFLLIISRHHPFSNWGHYGKSNNNKMLMLYKNDALMLLWIPSWAVWLSRFFENILSTPNEL